jgi:hypothetical protein
MHLRSSTSRRWSDALRTSQPLRTYEVGPAQWPATPCTAPVILIFRAFASDAPGKRSGRYTRVGRIPSTNANGAISAKAGGEQLCRLESGCDAPAHDTRLIAGIPHRVDGIPGYEQRVSWAEHAKQGEDASSTRQGAHCARMPQRRRHGLLHPAWGESLASAVSHKSVSEVTRLLAPGHGEHPRDTAGIAPVFASPVATIHRPCLCHELMGHHTTGARRWKWAATAGTRRPLRSRRSSGA